MKNLPNSFPAKVAAIIFSVLVLIFTVFFSVLIIFSASNEYYTISHKQAREETAQGLMYSYLYDIGYELFNSNGEQSNFYYNGNNFFYTASDADGHVIASTYHNQPTAYKFSREYSFCDPRMYNGEERIYKITGYLSSELTEGDDFYIMLNFVDLCYKWRFSSILYGFVGIIVFVILQVFLFCSAGRHKNQEKPVLNFIDKVPFDLYTAIMAFLLISLFWTVFGMLEISVKIFIIPLLLFLFVAGYLILLGYFMSFATRIKVGGLFKNTINWRLLRFCLRALKKLWSIALDVFHSISYVWKVILAFVAISLGELFLILLWGGDAPDILFIWLLEKIVIFIIALVAVSSFFRLKKGSEKIAAGELDYHVDTYNMWYDFKQFGNNINSISSGMALAVDERVKSERFRTELITNVSHDIKTPLTSIINYVDLIKKEQPEGAVINEYIDVLDRQSSRLKKLIEDLVEASKASTGNLTVNMECCELNVLLEQMVGEYHQRFEASGLIPVLTLPQKSVRIMADGRHLWRIIDNLLGNVCKYSQSDTRVYLTLEETAERAVITFRNISRGALNISGDELMERFVRGDSSRNTEGSGLGLSIAQSLAELQNGRLSIEIDGDLFKAILTFDTV